MDQSFEFMKLGSNNLLFLSVKCSNFGSDGDQSLLNTIIAAGCLLCCILLLFAAGHKNFFHWQLHIPKFAFGYMV